MTHGRDQRSVFGRKFNRPTDTHYILAYANIHIHSTFTCKLCIKQLLKVLTYANKKTNTHSAYFDMKIAPRKGFLKYQMGVGFMKYRLFVF